METKDVHNGNHNETVLQLVQGIFHDVRTLSTKEFTAAKLEAKQEIGKIAKASVSFGNWERLSWRSASFFCPS